MSDTDQERMDTVLRRMLATPPAPHKPKPTGKRKVDNSEATG